MSEYSIESSQNTPRDVPAFPTNDPDNGVYGAGISMRDYFAAKAMQGICAHQDTRGLTDENITLTAYKMADAMLAARERS